MYIYIVLYCSEAPYSLLHQMIRTYFPDKQVEYKLVEAENGELMCARDPSTGEPIKSPRFVVEIFGEVVL